MIVIFTVFVILDAVTKSAAILHKDRRLHRAEALLLHTGKHSLPYLIENRSLGSVGGAPSKPHATSQSLLHLTRGLQNLSWPYVNGEGHSWSAWLSEDRVGIVLSKNLTANTTVGAINEVFLRTTGMRFNVYLGLLFLSGIIIFEVIHRWFSDVDFSAELVGLEDMEEERTGGTGPFRGALKLWSSYFAQDCAYAFVCITLLIALICLGQYANALLVMWSANFYDNVALWASHAGSANTVAALNALILEFLFFAFMSLFAAIYKGYIQTMFILRVRAYFTYIYTDQWLTGFAYYQLLLPGVPCSGARNPDQRIQEDIDAFASSSTGLSLGIFTNVLQLCIFSHVVYGMSPEYFLGNVGWRFPGWLLWVCWLNAFVTTIAVHFTARRLEPLLYYNQRVEADFRWELGSVRTNSEQIALARGEDVLRDRTGSRFELIRRCIWEVMAVQKYLGIVMGFFDQLDVMFAFIFLGPSLIAGQITFGDLMSAQRAINLVVGSTLWFAHNYSGIVGWRASTGRLVRFGEAMDKQSTLAPDYVEVQRSSPEYVLRCQDLTLWQPVEASENLDESSQTSSSHRCVLFDQINFSVLPGQRILLHGPSGAGKTSLLRTLVGAWPFAEGRVICQDNGYNSLGFSSVAYLPAGELRAVVAFPLKSQNVDDAGIETALRTVGLGCLLSEGLGHTCDWTKLLSDGQKARISFARLCLHKPAFAAMDEPLAHLDERSQLQVLNAVTAALPDDASLLVVHHGMSAEARAFFNVHYKVDLDGKTITAMD